MDRLKVLAVADPASIHATRFVRLLQEIGCEVRMFHCEAHYRIEEHLADTTVYVDTPGLPPRRGNCLQLARPLRMAYGAAHAPFGLLNHFVQGAWRVGARHLRGDDALFQAPRTARAAELAHVIGDWRPKAVFSLRMQNEGYTAAAARTRLDGRLGAPWVHYCWGTDIELFGKDARFAPAHLPALREALAGCDYLIADSKRDLRAAPAFGFRGEALGDIVATGGFDLARLRELRRAAPPVRDVILVKGREGDLVGRSVNVLRALERVPAARRLRICILMASRRMRDALAGEFGGLGCEVLPRLAYEDLLALFARSRLAVSASDVDGTPGFLVEAMAMGALPVHSDMESVRDWITHGDNGLLFPVADIDALARCLERALADDALVAHAGAANWAIAEQRLDRARIRVQVRGIVERLRGAR